MFISLFRSLGERLKAMFSLDAAIDIEAQLIARHADRKAALFTKADELDAQGRGDVADELRKRAESLAWEKPLETAMSALTMADRDPVRLLADPTMPDSHKGATNGVSSKKSSRGRRRRP